MRKLVLTLMIALGVTHAIAGGVGDKKRILIYTKNGEGYVHDNIAASVAAMEKICAAEGYEADVSEDPSLFTPDKLDRYAVIIFSNSNNEAFDTDEQRQAFQAYIRGGGSFMAIHSANASERHWPWYWAMVGGKFVSHPPHQEFVVVRTDSTHLSTKHLPQRWTVKDECYYSNQLNPGIHVLLSVDLTTIEDENKGEYPGEVFGQQFPLAWCQEFEGGRQFYTALGHDSWFYEDPLFVEHLRGGLLWVLDK